MKLLVAYIKNLGKILKPYFKGVRTSKLKLASMLSIFEKSTTSRIQTSVEHIPELQKWKRLVNTNFPKNTQFEN